MAIEAASVARLGDRSLFPELAARVYVNHAAISAPPAPTVAATRRLVDDYARRGAGAFLEWHGRRGALRARLAQLIGARPDDVGLVTSTTEAILTIALCYPWRAGDRVIVYRGEFPANVTPWQRAAELFGLNVVMLPLSDFAGDGGSGLARLEAELSRGVRLVAVSAVQFQTGLRMPLAEMAALCHDRGAELSVDAVQACGVVPIDVASMGIDYLACGSHKWLMALEGIGFLYIHPERIRALHLVRAGWLSHEDGLAFLFEGPDRLRYDRPIRRRADFVEGHSLSAVGCAALDASVELLLSLGIERIYDHVSRYLDALEQGLVARGLASLRASHPSRRSGIVGVVPARDEKRGVTVVALQRELASRGVACSTPDGVLRFAPHWPNRIAEVADILAAVDEILPALRAG